MLHAPKPATDLANELLKVLTPAIAGLEDVVKERSAHRPPDGEA